MLLGRVMKHVQDQNYFWSFNGYHLRTLGAVRRLAAELKATAEREATA